MRASEVLAAVIAWHDASAFVPEITINDHFAASHNVGRPRDEHVSTSRRIDALMFDSLQRTAIEIKVTRADAARETWHKVDPWRRVTHRFVYVTPADLIQHPPVSGAGLWWVHEDGRVEVIRKATINRYPEPLPQHVIQTMAYRITGRTTIQRAEASA